MQFAMDRLWVFRLGSNDCGYDAAPDRSLMKHQARGYVDGRILNNGCNDGVRHRAHGTGTEDGIREQGRPLLEEEAVPRRSGLREHMHYPVQIRLTRQPIELEARIFEGLTDAVRVDQIPKQGASNFVFTHGICRVSNDDDLGTHELDASRARHHLRI